MVTPVSISNYISLPDDFPARNIAPQVKEVLKDFIDALSTIICDEEWRTSLNINSATKKIFNNLDNLSYIQRTSFRGNDTLYNEKVQFKLTYPVKNGRHKENIEFQVVINLSPIYFCLLYTSPSPRDEYLKISYAVFCLKKKKKKTNMQS